MKTSQLRTLFASIFFLDRLTKSTCNPATATPPPTQIASPATQTALDICSLGWPSGYWTSSDSLFVTTCVLNAAVTFDTSKNPLSTAGSSQAGPLCPNSVWSTNGNTQVFLCSTSGSFYTLWPYTDISTVTITSAANPASVTESGGTISQGTGTSSSALDTYTLYYTRWHTVVPTKVSSARKIQVPRLFVFGIVTFMMSMIGAATMTSNSLDMPTITPSPGLLIPCTFGESAENPGCNGPLPNVTATSSGRSTSAPTGTAAPTMKSSARKMRAPRFFVFWIAVLMVSLVGATTTTTNSLDVPAISPIPGLSIPCVFGASAGSPGCHGISSLPATSTTSTHLPTAASTETASPKKASSARRVKVPMFFILLTIAVMVSLVGAFTSPSDVSADSDSVTIHDCSPCTSITLKSSTVLTFSPTLIGRPGHGSVLIPISTLVSDTPGGTNPSGIVYVVLSDSSILTTVTPSPAPSLPSLTTVLVKSQGVDGSTTYLEVAPITSGMKSASTTITKTSLTDITVLRPAPTASKISDSTKNVQSPIALLVICLLGSVCYKLGIWKDEEEEKPAKLNDATGKVTSMGE
jgi:hypothetical protein